MRIVAITLFLSPFTVALGQPVSASVGQPEIAASGRGEVRIAPTSATITLGVTTRAPTAAQAASENATRMSTTMSALRAAGLAPSDVTNLGYTVSQNYEFQMAESGPRPGPQRVPAGFIAQATVRAQVRRLDDVGKVIDAALAAGATDVSGIQFSAANVEDARRTAMANAVRQVRKDAEAMAAAAGGSLGRLISLTSNAGPPGAYYSDIEFAGGSAALAPPPPPTRISPRDLTVSAQVFGRWEFIPATTR